MGVVYKYSLLALAACALISCKSENATVLHKKPASQAEAFIRDTSAYVTVVDTSVHDSVFREETIPVEQGGFVEYFNGRNQKKINATKIFYAYSDSISPFVKGHSESPTFADMVALAYARHYPMEISPDDVWLMLLDGFRLHVKSNRDALKDRFVGPGADTSIKVSANWLTLESSHGEWSGVITALFDELQQKIPAETAEPLRTKFSTTSPTDYNISRAMVLSVASEYYSYSVYTLCGIPRIKIEGTRQDWLLLKEAFNKLASRLDMEWWSEQLNPILDEFANAFDGKSGVEFWQRIFKIPEQEGCGNELFSGWLTKFYPYLFNDENSEFKRRTEWNGGIEFEQLPKVISSFDIKWDYLGREIPLKLTTGFVGIQVDTATGMLKASRGYALRSHCGWCNMNKLSGTLEYIPGKPLRLQEALAISDSMNFYDRNGLVYATHDRAEIEKFAMVADYEEEYLEDVFGVQVLFDGVKPSVSVNLYRKGELIEHLSYFAKLNPEVIPDSASIGAMQGIHGAGAWKNRDRMEAFFKERKISTEGESAEFAHEKSIPKLDVKVIVDSFAIKEGKSLKENLPVKFYKAGLADNVKSTCGWRLERAFYRHYKEGQDVTVDAELTFGEEGRVVKVDMDTEHPVYRDFLQEVKTVLYYGWMFPRLHYVVVEGERAQEIVHSIKIRVTFSKDSRTKK